MAKMIFRAIVATKPSKDGDVEANDVIFIFRGERGHLLAFDMLKRTAKEEKEQKMCEHLLDCISKLTDFFFNKMMRDVKETN